MAGFGFGTLLIVVSAIAGLTAVAVGSEWLRRAGRAREARAPTVVAKVVGPPTQAAPPAGKPAAPAPEAAPDAAPPPRPPQAPAFSTMRPIGSFGRRA